MINDRNFVYENYSVDICALAMQMILEEEEQRKLDEQKYLMEEMDQFDWGISS